MKPLIAVALSGGVDSMMAAIFLKEQGHKIIGIHFITGYETDFKTNTGGLTNESIEDQARRRIALIGDQLNIPIEVFNCRKEFQEKVVDYFTHTYQIGQTPNPCLVCNPLIKFGTILNFAQQLGADQFATGHYARIVKDPNGNIHLLRGVDLQKDQSYFLARLTPGQLNRALLPLGAKHKTDVKALAHQKGLVPIVAKESQDVCFIRTDHYGKFLAMQKGFRSEPGDIVDLEGNVIGRHKGLHLFTIGQRRGINCPAAEAYYVAQIDHQRNRLVVGLKQDLKKPTCRVSDINWIQPVPDRPMRVLTRIRYRHQAVPSIIEPINSQSAIVRFDKPQSAITPGQGAVFFKDEEVLGGGWIEADIK